MDALSVYFDASVIVPLFVVDSFVARASVFLVSHPADIFVSEFAAAEFASVIAMRCRKRALSTEEGRRGFANFDIWKVRKTFSAETLPVDVRAAEVMLRRLDLNLRTPDAIHIAIVQRLGAELATFDVRMADCARALGTPVIAL